MGFPMHQAGGQEGAAPVALAGDSWGDDGLCCGRDLPWGRMWPGWGPWAPKHGVHSKVALPTNADSVFTTVNCGPEAFFAGQRREQRTAGRNVLCENDNVTCFVIVFNVYLV